MKNLNQYLDSIGEKGSRKRLEAISQLNLGNRSEAAHRVLQKRDRRSELMDVYRFPRPIANLIVNREFKNTDES